MTKKIVVQKNKVIEIFITFYTAQGEELAQENCVYLHGGYDDILPKVEAALDHKEVGFETTLYLEPEDAFGQYDSNLVFLEPRELFPESVTEGMIFEGVPQTNEADALTQSLENEDLDIQDVHDSKDDGKEYQASNAGTNHSRRSKKNILIEDADQFAEISEDEFNQLNDSSEDPLFFVVQQVTPTHVLLDANPQWAGMALQVFCKIEAIRDATHEEIAQGYADGDDEDEDIHDLITVLPAHTKKTTLH